MPVKLRFLLFGLLFISCGKVKQVDTSDIREMMRNSKIKRVTEKQLLAKVSEIGEQLSGRINGSFRPECQQVYHIDQHRVEVYNAGLVSDTANGDVKQQLVQAYKYGIENGQPVGANIQKYNDTLFIYSFPLKQEAYLKNVCGNDFVFVIISEPELVKQL